MSLGSQDSYNPKERSAFIEIKGLQAGVLEVFGPFRDQLILLSLRSRLQKSDLQSSSRSQSLRLAWHMIILHVVRSVCWTPLPRRISLFQVLNHASGPGEDDVPTFVAPAPVPQAEKEDVPRWI